MSLHTSRPVARGFTLVELLVVIGIIALLIAILLPSLAAARRAALNAKCLTQLQQMMVAANSHAAERQGYWPLAGNLGGVQPASLSDSYQRHYAYVSDAKIYPYTYIAPITFSLGSYMGYKRPLRDDSRYAQLVDDKASNWLIRHFLCPSQASSPAEVVQPGLPSYIQGAILYIGKDTIPNPGNGGLATLYYYQAQSYIYNECALGYNDRMNRPHGLSTRIRQPSLTMFAADGMGGSYGRQDGLTTTIASQCGAPLMTVYNKATSGPVTLADAYLGNGKAGDPENFDRKRHRGKINIAFCDGHCESRPITADGLSNVYLMAP